MKDEDLIHDRGRAVGGVFVLVVVGTVDPEGEVHEGRRRRHEIGDYEVYVNRRPGEVGVDGVVGLPGVIC